MRKLIVSILLITSLSNAGVNECFENGHFNSNIGHDTLDCGNVDVVSWAMGVIETRIYDTGVDQNVYQYCTVEFDPEHESDIVINACNVFVGGE